MTDVTEKKIEMKETSDLPIEVLKWRICQDMGDRVQITKKSTHGHTLFRVLSRKEWETKYPESQVEIKKEPEKVEEKKEEEKMEVEEKIVEKPKYEPTRSGMCDRCNEEVKFPPLKCFTPKCPKQNITFDQWGAPSCSDCLARIQPVGNSCPSCKYYIPAPNEVFDASRVNFSLPEAMTAKIKGIMLATTQHDMPIPQQTEEDITKDHALNEAVFNRLPWTEEQKKNMLQSMTKEQLLKDRENKRKEEVEQQKKSTKQRRHEKPKGVRTSVKDTTFSTSTPQ